MAVISAREYRGAQEKKPESPVLVSEAEEDLDLQGPAPRKKPRAEDPWFHLDHPDNTPSNMITCEFDMNVGGFTEKVKIEHGRVETQVKEVKDELLRRGYRLMNEEF